MNENLTVYEIGFHITPSLTDEEVEKTLSSLKDAITKNGGNIIGEESPKVTNLSYPIIKRSDTGAKSFSKAFFGWIKFESESENVSKINDFAKMQKDILRFLLIKTERANVVTFHKNISVLKEEEADFVSPEKDGGTQGEVSPKPKPENKNVSDQEIDETIDSLIVG